MPIQDKLPKSRITLTYRTNISGQEQEVDLPFRVLVLGDYSLGSSKDRKQDLEDRKLRSVTGNNINDLMKDMDMSVEFEVPNKINPSAEENIQVQLKIDRMKSFNPDEIVHQVPKLKALLLLRKLLLEMQSDIDNRKELRRTLYELYSNPEELKKLMESEKLKAYEPLRLPADTGSEPTAKPASGPDVPAAKPN
ncbi:type VI secretion system contractile sheath small subunit [Archangium violaceum]|uniref:type VI secretion system contractile sheath small subunit n=1 Tax=Archangium violaceum TaxID=83451 RepID=UPI00193B9B30|nr:type VI secretion system contractile sheath small subunit [Archangium violaceum]QRK06972.1 type VI secretion system contractile sheath small subunit [Archangium violaceum]